MIRAAKLLSIILLFGLSSCFDEETFPSTPRITFQDLFFIDTQGTDSLILTFDFEDGDADVGIVRNDLDHAHLVYLDSRNYIVTEDNMDTLVPPLYAAPLFLEKFIPLSLSENTLFLDNSDSDYPVLLLDTTFYSNSLSDIRFECPGIINQDGELFKQDNAILYALRGDNRFEQIRSQDLSGRIPTQYTETFNNLIIIFEEKTGDSYEPLNYQEIFQNPNCEIGIILNGRIPWFDPEGKSGTITYTMSSTSFGFVAAFLDKTTRLRFYLYDRAGNKSNEAFSPDFILSDITR